MSPMLKRLLVEIRRTKKEVVKSTIFVFNMTKSKKMKEEIQEVPDDIIQVRKVIIYLIKSRPHLHCGTWLKPKKERNIGF
jgi:hypothetical protein